MSRAANLAAGLITAAALAAGALTYWRVTAPEAGGEAHVRAPEIPQAAIARLFTTEIRDASGNPFAFSSLRGRTVVVNFWATWCPPCLREMPELSESSRKYADKGVQFVGIGIDSPGAIKEYVYRRPVSYPILIGGSEGLELARVLGNASGALPFTVIVDPAGRAVFVRLGAVEAADLDRVLAPLAARAAG